MKPAELFDLSGRTVADKVSGFVEAGAEVVMVGCDAVKAEAMPAHSPAPMRDRGGCGVRGAEANT